jgi:septum formation protein
MNRLILASGSASRQHMLAAAGVAFNAMSPDVDESALKAAWKSEKLGAAALALRLAEAKAQSLMTQGRTALILGSDQVLQRDDGLFFDKAESLGALADQLRSLAGRTHRLFSAAVIVEDWLPVWSVVDSARMTMRPMSDAFIADYLACEGESILGCVGGYKIEGRGAQLLTSVEGSQFVVQGLPLLPLLDYLRTRNFLTV